MRGSSKREHCPKCHKTDLPNYIHVEPGHDIEVFVECSDCREFVARYTLKTYTSDDFYRSYLRFIHQRRMNSGTSTKKALEDFKNSIKRDFEKVKKDVKEHEETRRIEELIEKL